VHIKVIGHVGRRNPGIEARQLLRLRLHTRTLIRDRRQAFIGSQSLRAPELDSRREVGVIVRDRKVVAGLLKTFESDWVASAVPVGSAAVARARAHTRAMKKMSKGLVKQLSTLSPMVKEALKEAKAESAGALLSLQETKDSVREAVKEAVRDAVQVRVDAQARSEAKSQAAHARSRSARRGRQRVHAGR
jgi:phosphatidylserine/phosphatidylglycerophosphate/cardiolipin synthase-like enzyme